MLHKLTKKALCEASGIQKKSVLDSTLVCDAFVVFYGWFYLLEIGQL